MRSAAGFKGMLVLALLVSGGCATVPEGVGDRRSDTAEARKLLRAGEYDQAVEQLERQKARATGATEAQQARLDLMYAYYKTGEYAQARQEANGFIQRFGASGKAPYAYYIRGLASHEQAREGWSRLRGTAADAHVREARTAFGHFAELLRRYPESPYTEDAVQRMVELRDEIGHHELRLAEEHMAQGDYGQAADRARYVADNYTGAAPVPEALALVVRAERAAGNEHAAQRALERLDTNHPDHPALERLRQAGDDSR